MIQIMILVLSVVSVYFAQMELAALLFALAALGIIGRIWAKATVKRFTVKVKAEKTRMFPDEEISVTYRMKNEKFLPVLWVDILQPLEYPVCMAPADETGSLCLRPMTKSEKEFFRYREEEKIRVFQERCSMIGPYRTVSFTTKWRAVQRGVYTLTHTRIYTGDGFGTTRYRMEPAAGSQNQFTIYPRIVAVNVERFVKNMWEGESGAKGTLEDLSVMKLTRPYESTDSLKKINWRLVARGQGLTVNQYEVISPRAVQFIFDGEAFNGCLLYTSRCV